jgi:DNA polymerase (family 10)
MTNAAIAAIFERIGAVLNLQGENPFRVRAYDRAAQTIASMSEELKTVFAKGGRDALLEIPGIGKDLGDKIEELLSTGKLVYLEELQKKVPAGLFDIMDISGMGPKKTKFVWEEFKVTDIPSLEKLATSGKLLGLKSWGEKSVQNILSGIEAKKKNGGRTALPVALAVAEQFKTMLEQSKLCDRIEIAGSVRRRKESIGDIDLLVAAKEKNVAKIMELFCTADGVAEVLAKGETKSSVRLQNALQIDVRVVPMDVFGAALHYFTGSKEHNVHVRQIGIRKGCTISEWGVYEGTAAKKGTLMASKTEEEVYAAVGLPYIPPELREDRGGDQRQAADTYYGYGPAR